MPLRRYFRKLISGSSIGLAPHLKFPEIRRSEPLKLKPDLPVDVERIIVKTLEKDREVRCQTASELRADLKRLKRDTDSGGAIGAKAEDADDERRSSAPRKHSRR